MQPKSVFLLDVDQTCYDGFSPFDLAINEQANGLISAAELSLLQEDMALYKQGKLSYEAVAVRYIDHGRQILQGKRRADFVANAQRYFRDHQDKFYPFLREIRQKYATTHDFYFISSGYDYALEVMVELFDFAGYRSNEIEVEGDVFGRGLARAIYDAADKEKWVRELLTGYDLAQSVGMGDSTADVGILESCRYGLAVNPSAELKAVAAENGWRVTKPDEVSADLESLLGK